MTSHRWWIALTAVYAALLLGIWLRWGVRMGYDTPAHLNATANVLDWRVMWPMRIWYGTYYVIMALVGVGAGWYGGIMLVQAVVAIVAFAVFLRTMDQRFGRVAAFVTGGLYLVMLDVQVWHFYLYSESLFTSAGLLVLLAWTANDLPARRLWWLIPVTVLVAMTRPTGVVILTIMGWCLYQRLPAHRQRQAIWGFAIAGIGLLVLMNTMLRAYPYLQMNAVGYIIYGYDDWFLLYPKDIPLPPKDTPPLLALAQFFAAAPTWTLQLWTSRIWAQMVPLRPYFSPGHNLYLAVYVLVVYPLAVWGFWRGRHTRIAQACLIYILSTTLICMLLWADWDNRFWVPTVAPMCILAGIAWQDLWSRRG